MRRFSKFKNIVILNIISVSCVAFLNNIATNFNRVNAINNIPQTKKDFETQNSKSSNPNLPPAIINMILKIVDVYSLLSNDINIRKDGTILFENYVEIRVENMLKLADQLKEKLNIHNKCNKKNIETVLENIKRNLSDLDFLDFNVVKELKPQCYRLLDELKKPGCSNKYCTNEQISSLNQFACILKSYISFVRYACVKSKKVAAYINKYTENILIQKLPLCELFDSFSNNEERNANIKVIKNNCNNKTDSFSISFNKFKSDDFYLGKCSKVESKSVQKDSFNYIEYPGLFLELLDESNNEILFNNKLNLYEKVLGNDRKIFWKSCGNFEKLKNASVDNIENKIYLLKIIYNGKCVSKTSIEFNNFRKLDPSDKLSFLKYELSCGGFLTRINTENTA